MRNVLIALQAFTLSMIAVYGAYASAESAATCPLPQAKAAQSCDVSD
ncbi:MAG: hypothetical protein AAFW87_04115 [Pseudomonadota bacterium]